MVNRGSIPFLERRVTGRDVALVGGIVVVLLGLMALVFEPWSGGMLGRLQKVAPRDVQRITMTEYAPNGRATLKVVEIPGSDPLVRDFLGDFEAGPSRLTFQEGWRGWDIVMEAGKERFSGEVRRDAGAGPAFFSFQSFRSGYRGKSVALGKLVEKYFPLGAEAKK